MRARGARLIGLAVALNTGLATPAATAGLSAEEETGKRIYFEGRGDGAPIFAYFGRDDVRMTAVLLPCASCHGHDGLGRPEGGLEPTNITWRYLTKSYGHRHSNGREHGPFDEDSIVGAIAGGVDPAGNVLDPLMPRYDMDEADFGALIAFLKRLESALDPGLSETEIRIGTLLPEAGAYGSVGAATVATIRAYFNEVNAAGGLFGRRLELVVAKYADDPARTAENARRLVEEDGGVFAVLGAFAIGVEREVFAIFEDAGAPQIDPFTLFAGHGDFPAERTFFLLSGLPDQARALVAFAAEHVEPAPGAIAAVLPPAAVYDEVAQAFEDQARRSGWATPAVLRLAGGEGAVAQAVTELRQSGIEAVCFFGDTAVLGQLAAAAAARGWLPRLFLPGQTAGRAIFDLPRGFDGRTHLAYPNLPEDQSAAGREEFRALRDKYGLAVENFASQLRALAAAKVLVEGLRQSGRSLNRPVLVAELEGLAKFDTGQVPPLSFGSNRRVGVRGAHVLTLDLAAGRFRPGSAWVAVD